MSESIFLTVVLGLVFNHWLAMTAFLAVGLWFSPRDMFGWWASGPILGQFLVGQLWPLFVFLWLRKDRREAR